MPFARKRCAEAEASPTSPPTRRRRSPSSSAASEDGATQNDADNNHAQMVKKLVRLAIASETSRQPLRRADISSKVLTSNAGRAFKSVFASAQKVLQDTFGMTLTELPMKEKITVSQKRAAQRAGGGSQASSSSSKAYILTSTLPSSLRTPTILAPSRILGVTPEASYTGWYTFVVSVIFLSQGSRCSENYLERIMKKVNADNYILGDKMERMLKRMEKEGYIVKVKEREAGGEETVDWVVGPRGKVEIGEQGVAGCVKSVFAKKDSELEELEARLEKSLGSGTFKKKEGDRAKTDNERQETNELVGGGERAQRPVSGRGGRRRRPQEVDEDDEDKEDGEDDDDEGE